jgi:CRISPR/Cas system-associated endoribonuclease Cas2
MLERFFKLITPEKYGIRFYTLCHCCQLVIKHVGSKMPKDILHTGKNWIYVML